MVGVDERPPLIAITGGEWNDLPHCTTNAAVESRRPTCQARRTT